MVKAIIAGRPPHEVLELASERLKASREELFDALQGELTASHCFVLDELMRHIEEIEARIARFDARLLEGLASQRNALALLQTLPNVDLIGAAMLLVEIGSNMDAFGSADRLASWVGICRATTSRQGSVNQVVSAKAISMSEGFFANSRMPPAAPRLSSSQSSRR
jgi:transposase